MAIKRILNGEKKGRTGSRGGSKDGSIIATGSKDVASVEGSAEINRYAQSGDSSVDIEGQSHDSNSDKLASRTLTESLGSGVGSMTVSGNVNMDFLVQMSFDRPRGKLFKWFPWLFHDSNEQSRLKNSILGSASGGSTSKSTLASVFCPWFDKQTQRRNEFVQEMRLLSRLRHPCITTVMGAVIGYGHVSSIVDFCLLMLGHCLLMHSLHGPVIGSNAGDGIHGVWVFTRPSSQ